MSNPGKSSAGGARTAISFIGAGSFFIGSIVVTFLARRSQLSGLPMGAGNGRELSYSDGYKAASLMLLLSLVYAWRAWILTHRKAA